MDREITLQVRRRRTLRRIAMGAPVLALAWGLLVLLPGWLRPSVSRARILTAKVERGSVEATIEASGTVIPSREKAISSPIDSRVIRIRKRPGQSVGSGEEILELDTSATKLELERLEDRLAQKRNEQRQAGLALERSLDELRGRIQRAELDVEILQARHRRNVRMSADALISEETVKESEVEARKADIELTQLRQSVENAQRSTRVLLDGIALDVRTLEKEMGEARHQLELAIPRSDEEGVVTWIVPEEGASVRRGDVLARIARLDAFRVEATVSDVHAVRLVVGLPVRAMVGGRALAGTLSNVYPKIENGAVRFSVELEEASSPLLRQNLRVDVLVITGVREGVLRVRRGPFAQGGAVQQVFVVEGEQAVRKSVSLGLSGREFFEVLDGLGEGDEVIVSDMTDYMHLEKLGVKS